MKKFICYALVAILFVAILPTSVFGAAARSYTYSYNEWGAPIPSPDAYRVSAYILGQHLYFNGENIGAFHSPQDIHVHGNLLYLVDSGNHRIIIMEFFEDTTFEVIDIRTYALRNGEQTTFSNPHGIYISPWEANYGQIWLADTENHRVLHLDENWHVLNEVLHPGIYGISQLSPESDFFPTKLAVDFSGRLFVQARAVNRGFMEFDRYGVFAGYMGAPPVEITPWDQLWRFIATQEQRERRLLNVPVEYNNLSIDHEGFIFGTISQVTDNLQPVVRLNMMGDDVLIRNGWAYPVGDLWYGQGADRSGPSEFVAVTALPNNNYVVFDRNRGRLFAYDTQGNLLYVWGGPGNREGFFTMPAALDNMGFTLFALDAGIGANFANLTRFDLTEYGALVNDALEKYHQGLYQESYYLWHDVLRINGNFGMAYTGIARNLLRLGYYREAMELFRYQNDEINFGRAFGFYRRIWMEDNFWIFVVVIATLAIVPAVVKKILKVRREIRES
ncbi:MAG: hypothetical protein FWF78_05160 [Defluviitaleaceae bacterium]|nr:hypothetical protein [Defluviitaleaceae bacterium]